MITTGKNKDRQHDALPGLLDTRQATSLELARLGSELDELNQKLQASEQQKDRFLSHMRNEINNPMASILALSQQSLERPDPDGSFHDVLRMIYAEMYLLNCHLENVFMAAEMEAGEATPRWGNVDLVALIDELLIPMESLLRYKGIVVDNRLASSETVVSDSQMLSLMLRNLIKNAIEFSPSGATIIIDLNRTEGGLLLSVVDFGSGISAQDQEVIFDRFRQLESGTTKLHQGLGLGLGVIKSLLDLLEIELQLTSTPGQGSRFELTLPDCPEMANEIDAKDDILFDNVEFF